MGSMGSVLSRDTAAAGATAEPASDWVFLPKDVLRLSARFLPEADRVRVGHVCRHWRAAVSGDRCVMGRPWILARPRWFRRSQYGLLRLSDCHENVGTFVAGGAAIPSSLHDVLGASLGWLAVRDIHSGAIILMDPNSPTAGEIALPGGDDLPPGYRIKSVFLSGDPFAAAPGCEAFAIAASADGRNDTLASCRRGDTSWTLIDSGHHHSPFRRYRTVAFHRDRVLTVDHRQRKLVCINGGGGAITRTKIPGRNNNDYANNYWARSASMAWLVECGGELLHVELQMNLVNTMARCCCGIRCLGRWKGTDGKLGVNLRVSKVAVDEDDDAPAAVGTALVTNIGDYALFVGELGHAFAVEASGLAGVRSNFVYYVGNMAERMVAFDLTTFWYEAPPYSRRRGVSAMAGQQPLCWFGPRRTVATT